MIDIGICFDQKYALPARALVESVLRHSGLTQPRIFCVTAGVAPAEIARLGAICRGRAELHVIQNIQPRHSHPSSSPNLSYLTSAMYLRLNLPEVLPADSDRILYLDCDILCVGPLTELSSLDLAGNTIAAVTDPGVRTLSALHDAISDTTSLRLLPDDEYFNSGVLLIDVQQWNATNVSGESLRVLENSAGILTYPDQDALNAVLHNRWHRLGSRYNQLESWKLENGQRFPTDCVSLIHCAGTKKFWNADFPVGFRRETFWNCHDEPRIRRARYYSDQPDRSDTEP